ncbi:MAG: hypothetical protein M1817_002206, partial [Caeruleum heppii]
MPILQIKTEDPDHPGAYMTCGQSRNPYWNGGFLQFGSSFSRTDGINAIKQFCNDQADKKRIVGKKGIIPSYDSSRKAIPLVVSSYQNQHDDNKVMVRMQIDEENWNGGIGDCGESDKTFFDFGRDPRTDVVNNCIRMFGQTVEYCDRVEGKESTDPSV